MATNEPSRSHPGGGVQGRFPNLSGHKLRLIARNGDGELNAAQQRAQQLFRTEEPDFYAREVPRNVHTVLDVTRGLGLDNVDVQKVHKLVGESNATFTRSSGNQRLLHSRGNLLTWLRTQPQISSDARNELAVRATAFWSQGQTDYGPRLVVKAARKSLIPVLLKSQLRGG